MESRKFKVGDTIRFSQDKREGIGVVSGFDRRNNRYIVRGLEDNDDCLFGEKHTCGRHFDENVGWFVSEYNAELIEDVSCKTDISSDDLLRILSHE